MRTVVLLCCSVVFHILSEELNVYLGPLIAH